MHSCIFQCVECDKKVKLNLKLQLSSIARLVGFPCGKYLNVLWHDFCKKSCRPSHRNFFLPCCPYTAVNMTQVRTMQMDKL